MMQELWADAIGNMDSDLVERFVLMEQSLEEKKPVKVIAWKKWSLATACLLLAVGIGTGGALQYLKRTEPAPTLPTPSVEVPGVETPPENDVDEDQSPFDEDYSYEMYLEFVTSKVCLNYRNGFVTYERVCLFGEFEKMNLWGYSYTGAEITYFLNDRGRSVELLIDPYKSLYDLPEQEITDAVFEDCDMRRIVYTEQYQPSDEEKTSGCYYRIGDTYYIYDADLRLQGIRFYSHRKQYTLTVEGLSEYPMQGENAVIHNLLDREKAYAQIKALLSLWEAE